MRDTDLEKLKAFEAWLQDVGEETRKTIERNGIISAIVRSGDYWRIFTTESFTIRALVIHLTRYCPDYEIMAIRYGVYPTQLLDNMEWRKLEKEEVTALSVYFNDFANIGDKEAIIGSNAPYRDALNIWYIKCAQNREYPSKTPFKGVQIQHIPFEAAIEYGTCVEHPFFVSDEDTIYTSPSDILNHYDGKRLERTIGGRQVKGYLIEKCRLEYKRGKSKRNV